MTTTSRSRTPFLVALLAAVPLVAACDKPRSLGEANEIIVAAPTQLWQALAQDLRTALEPSTFTVRDERVFDIAHADPSQAGWDRLRLLRQVLLIGSVDDPAVAEAIEHNNGDPPTPPAILQVRNVWAQNQLVTILLTNPGATAADVQPLLNQAGELFLYQYEEYARARMFVTSADELLADSLRREAGFTLTLPQVYHYSQLEPGLFVFRNDQPDPSRLIRSITVDSRPSAEVEFSADAVALWREEIAQKTTIPAHVSETAPEFHTMQVGGHDVLQIQGVWGNPPGEWPAAGPFFTRIVNCGDRTFLVDAWLYAPGSAKYEYMYQLNTIVGSFECAT